jgi:hypothetical protein
MNNDSMKYRILDTALVDGEPWFQIKGTPDLLCYLSTTAYPDLNWYSLHVVDVPSEIMTIIRMVATEI